MADSFGGQNQFESYLKAAREAAEAEARRACQVSADELAARVKGAVPKGHPERGHIQDSVVTFQKDANTWGVRVGNDAQPYAAFLEFGHRDRAGNRVRPLKFFFPSVRVTNKRHRARLIRWFRKAIRSSGAAS